MKTMNLKGFIELKTLGKGTYGNVYKARRESDGKCYAVKVVNLGFLNQREIEDSVNEIRLMASFQSPFIIRFYEAFCDHKRLCVVSEYSRMGDLAHLIERRKKKDKPLKEDVIWCYFLQLLHGIHVLHSAGVVHRDLKSANILISAPDLIKIADLGISTVLRTRDVARTQIGTPLYIAPEVWKRKPYNQKCDIWSLGVLLYEMMTFSYPFTGLGSGDLALRVCRGLYTVPSGKYSKDLISVLKKLLQVNPVLRPSTSDLMNMPEIKSRMHMATRFIDDFDTECGANECLLATIKVPQNLRNINLPDPTYSKKADIIKPMEQRLHMKKGIPIKKDLPLVSSQELQMIADLDWWSPNKETVESENENEDGNVLVDEIKLEVLKRPESQRVRPPQSIQERAAAPRIRNIRGKQKPMYEYTKNPRFRRYQIR